MRLGELARRLPLERRESRVAIVLEARDFFGVLGDERVERQPLVALGLGAGGRELFVLGLLRGAHLGLEAGPGFVADRLQLLLVGALERPALVFVLAPELCGLGREASWRWRSACSRDSAIAVSRSRCACSRSRRRRSSDSSCASARSARSLARSWSNSDCWAAIFASLAAVSSACFALSSASCRSLPSTSARAFSARFLKSSLAFLARSLSAWRASDLSLSSASSRSSASNLSSNPTWTAQRERPVMRLDNLAVLLGELLLEGEDLLVLLVEPLAQIEKLAARDAARLGWVGEPCPGILDLASEALVVRRIDPELLDLAPSLSHLLLEVGRAVSRERRILTQLLDLARIDRRGGRKGGGGRTAEGRSRGGRGPTTVGASRCRCDRARFRSRDGSAGQPTEGRVCEGVDVGVDLVRRRTPAAGDMLGGRGAICVPSSSDR